MMKPGARDGPTTYGATSVHYRVSYKLTSPHATSKARLVESSEPGALTVEFVARTHTAAREALQELVANGDDRPVMGRSNVRDYVVRETEETHVV